ncbi:hypothetical protein CONLIGDRAFT_683382 [Coniochaeta ligniaria NRRL 30616]|uniref:Uncharacterized protein n=1 Tax=Coniochaeta ligniaria NRRL 30616 TaxID=1408157 RepID=A0A1J7IG08_9PEZI|nr:hypothetical protein CONLIGDRAFT_683382 [Coniochaeta ligniaria NRRL 30616]
MEANRLWHDPVVEIYANAITPGVCCSAAAYDLANRRWYQLNIGDGVEPSVEWRHNLRLAEVPDDDWLSSTVEKHIQAYYSTTSTPPPWNTINTNSSGSPATFEVLEEPLVRRPIIEKFIYGHRPSDKLPTTRFDQLREKTYLSRGADYCLWNSRKCVFKRIEFDCDVESHENEIRTREAIIECLAQNPEAASKDLNREMESRFNVVPVLAVVLHDETSNWIVSQHGDDEDPEYSSNHVAGILLPYAGRSLDLLSAAASDGSGIPPSTSPSMSSPSMTARVPISEEQLLDLACGIQNLSNCGIVHGDICYWNTILTHPDSTESLATRLLLIDMGDVAPDYQDDFDALGTLLLWCLSHSAAVLNDDKGMKRIVIAAALLKDGDISRAIGVLSPSKSVRSKLKRSFSTTEETVKRRRHCK